jgi:hypothetical protein
MNNVDDLAVDDRFYQVVKPNSPVEAIMIKARDRIYDDFIDLMRPTSTEKILDVGTSDVFNDAANVLERKYAYPENITAAGIGKPDGFQKEFPKIQYRQILPNQPLPFSDDAFDIATSNAVIEHVGSAQNQQFFVSELLRVARRVFITAPNGLFPVEHHTAIPLLHFWRPSFELACKLTKKEIWLDPSELMLVRRKTLLNLIPAHLKGRIGYTGIMMGPFSSNIYLKIARE